MVLPPLRVAQNVIGFRHFSEPRFCVQAEPLIPDTPRRVLPSAFGVDQQIARIFQMMEDAFGRIW
jgi:hypothetical protein